MWLLNAQNLKLEAFVSSERRPKYAILSHTWHEQEVLFSHVVNLTTSELEKLKGYAKVKASCAQARKDGYQYIWVDTCCIDKTSSAELSEAINSMWAWYRDSDVCYAFLSDVKKGSQHALRKSKWFTRGWTLQELIAPDRVRFFDMDWNEMEDRLGMASLLSAITRIDQGVLTRNQEAGHTHNSTQAGTLCVQCGKLAEIEQILLQTSVASKMSWSAHRETTRSEDRSYSLLGLFGVNMPLLYGEGRYAAWGRLLEEIVKTTNDQSILAFDNRLTRQPRAVRSMSLYQNRFRSSVFSEHAGMYLANVQLPDDGSSKKMRLVAGDLLLDIWLCPLKPKDPKSTSKQRAWDNLFVGLLDCKVEGDALAWPAIVLRPVSGSENEYVRERNVLLMVDRQDPPTLRPCRHPRSESHTESDLTALNMTYDLQKATLQQITILNRAPDKASTSTRHSSHYSKPTQIMPIIQQEHLEYRLDSSYPDRLGDSIEKIPVFWSGLHQVMGMAIFSNHNRQPFMVTWGPAERRDGSVGSWCKLTQVSKDDVAPEDYEMRKHNLAGTLRSQAWETNKSLKLQDFKIGDSRLWNKDALAFGDVYASVEIEEVKALDREVWQLQIRISPIRRQKEEESNRHERKVSKSRERP